MRVLVIDKNRKPGKPTTPKRARILLKSKKAAIIRRNPFTIILLHEIGVVDPAQLQIDPGGTTGIALVDDHHKSGKVAIMGVHLHHRTQEIKSKMLKRANVRKNRRARKTRYREARFLNRARVKGWLPPSLLHRVKTTMTWIKRFIRYAPVGSIVMELNKFDPQKMLNPEIKGIEYQQGTLEGFEMREFLLFQQNYACAYCKKHGLKLEAEHIIPRSRGGSNCLGNIVMACRPCNEKKGTKTAKEFGHPEIESQMSLREAAYMNAVRLQLKQEIEKLGLPCSFPSGIQTEKNRRQQNYPKDHWIDAACAGDSGENVQLESMEYLDITCTGHGKRQMVNVNGDGWPKGKAKARQNVYFGFRTGDYVKAIVIKGKKKGVYIGRVSCRGNGSFKIKTKHGTIDGVNHKYIKPIQKSDGFSMFITKSHD